MPKRATNRSKAPAQAASAARPLGCGDSTGVVVADELAYQRLRRFSVTADLGSARFSAADHSFPRNRLSHVRAHGEEHDRSGD